MHTLKLPVAIAEMGESSIMPNPNLGHTQLLRCDAPAELLEYQGWVRSWHMFVQQQQQQQHPDMKNPKHQIQAGLWKHRLGKSG